MKLRPEIFPKFFRLAIGAGRMVANIGGMTADRSSMDSLQALISNVNNYAVAATPVALAGSSITLTAAQVQAGVTRLLAGASGPFTINFPITARLIDALGPTVPLDGSFSVPISFQNEDPTNTGTLVAGDAGTTFTGNVTIAPGTRHTFLMTLTAAGTISIQDTGTMGAVQSSSAANVTFLQSGTGAVIRDAQGKMRDVISAFDFMTPAQIADVQARTLAIDVSVPLQAAITASYGRALYLPGGKYKITPGLIQVTSSLKMFGDGMFNSIIVWTQTTGNAIAVASDGSIECSDFWMQGPGGATSGANISLTGSGTHNTFSRFNNMLFSGGFDHIATAAAAYWVADGCYFSGQVRRAVTVSNTFNVDNGDSTIVNCTFGAGIAGSIDVYHVSSGGLRVLNNKFNGNGAYAYQMQLAAGAVTSDLIWIGNSMENFTSGAMKFATDGGGASYSNIIINANQIALTPIGIDASGTTAFLSTVNVGNNVITLNASGTSCINFGNGNGITIGGNTLKGTGGTPTGILLAATCSNTQINPNTYLSLTTPVNDSSTSKQRVGFTDTLVGGDGFLFPATQVSSANVNVLDDYEEGTWTPVLTFATPGDLNVVYSAQVGTYTKIGNVVTLTCNIVTSTFTFTTASGSLQVTGAPFAANATANAFNFAAMSWQGITKAGYTQVSPRLSPSATTFDFPASGSAQAVALIAATDTPTAGTMIIRFSITYRTAT